MSKIKGQNFRLFVRNAAVPEAVNCSITVTGNMEDGSTKDTMGAYSEETMASRSWSAQVESYQATPAELKALVTVFNDAAPVPVGFDQTKGTQNREAADASFRRSGNAILNDLSIRFNDRATVTVTTQYQGTGDLTL